MKSAFLMAYELDGWHVFRLDRTSLAERFVQAGEGEQAALRAALRELGAARETVCLGLPSSMIFSAEIDCVDLPRKQRRNVMLYRLEEQLPHDIERMTSDFLPIVGGKALGLSVETEEVKQIVQRLEDAGIEVASICPTALLAAWQALRESFPCDYAIVGWCGTVDIFRLVGGQPAAWYTLRLDAEEIHRCLRMDRVARPLEDSKAKVMLIAAAEEVPESIQDWSEIELLPNRSELPVQAAAGAQRHLAGDVGLWGDFRRDALASANIWGRFDKTLKAALVLALLVPLLFAAAFFYRAWSYEQVVRDNEVRKQSLYHQLFPNTQARSGVKRLLESELQRAAGLSGAAEAFPRQVNALNTLRSMAESLPESARFTILDLWVNPESITIEGQTRSHGEAELIMNSLSDGGFVMDAPRTERLASGDVSFTLSGQVKSEELRGSNLTAKPADSAESLPADAAGEPAMEVQDEAAAEAQPEDQASEEPQPEEVEQGIDLEGREGADPEGMAPGENPPAPVEPSPASRQSK